MRPLRPGTVVNVFLGISAIFCAGFFFVECQRSAARPSAGQFCVDVLRDYDNQEEVWERPADILVGTFHTRAEADAFVARIGAPLCAELDFRQEPHKSLETP